MFIYTWLRLGATGGAALVIGGVSGVMVEVKADEVDEHCDRQKRCNDVAFEAASDGRTFATLSAVGLLAGAAAVGGGLYLLLSDSSTNTRASAWHLRVAQLPGGAFAAAHMRF